MAYAKDRAMEEATAALHRAVAICQFYPDTHPLWKDAMEGGYGAFLRAAEDERLAEPGLLATPSGLFLAGAEVGMGNPGVGYLLHLFLSHGIARIRRTGHLSPEGYAFFVSLLSAASDLVEQRGGFPGLWARSPHVHALDITFGAGKAAPVKTLPASGWANDWSTPLPRGREAEALSDPKLLARLKAFQQKGPAEQELLDLLFRSGQPGDPKTLSVILDRIAEITADLVSRQQFRPAFQAMVFLLREARNQSVLGRGESAERLYAALRTVLRGSFLHWLTFELAETADQEDAEMGEYLLRLLGETAVVYLINALSAERSRLGRRRLVSALVGIGAPAMPFAVKMLDDQRWFVVRNMISVLGGMGDPSVIGILARFRNEPDPRVQKEAVRALGRFRRADAEELLCAYVRASDPSVRRMAAFSLAGQKTGTALAFLTEEFERMPLGADDWEVKVALVEAVGGLGMPDAVPFLESILTRRPWLNRGRWERIQLAAVLALGEIGGAEAIRVLEPVKNHPHPDFKRAAERSLAAASSPPPTLRR